MIILLLLLLALELPGAVTLRTVRTTGGDYPATLPGLQSAVDFCRTLNAVDPCVIEVEAGLTLSDNSSCVLVLNAQTVATKLIMIRSSRLSEIPEGVRVTPADAPKLVKIQNNCPSSPGVIIVPPEVTGVTGSKPPSHYVLQGFELHYAGEGRNAGGAINIGLHTDGSTKARAHWQAPHTITVDRCWAHGNDTATWVLANSTHANQKGIRVDGRNILVKNSRFDHNNMDNSDHGQGESHGLAESNAPGPLYIYNNHIDGAIGSLLGGEWTWIPGLVMTGAWFFGNEYTRSPVAWHWNNNDANYLDTTKSCVTGAFWQETSGSTAKWKCVGGAWTSSSEVRLNRPWVKNAWECKNCRMVSVEGNYIHDIPSTGDQSQFGFAFLANNVDAQDGAFHARPERITVRYNLARNVGQGPTIAWIGDTRAFFRTRHLTFADNILLDVFSYSVSPRRGSGFATAGGGSSLQVSGMDAGLRFERNTVTMSRSDANPQAISLSNGIAVNGIVLRDNILPWGTMGQTAQESVNEACTAFNSILGQPNYWNNFALVDTHARGQSTFNFWYTASGCPSTAIRSANYASVGFVNGSITEGDYRLCTAPGVPDPSCGAASPLATASSSGGPLGADAVQVGYATAGVESGTPDYAFLEFKIRRADKNEIRYTAYNDQACSGTVKGLSGTVAYSWTDAGGNRERAVTPGTLVNGSYTARVTCAGGRWREEQMVVF